MNGFSYLLSLLFIPFLTSAQDEFEVFDLLATRTSTASTTTTTDILSQWIADLRKQEQQKARNLLVIKKNGERNAHPLCKLYCQLFELCVMNELLRPLCGKPAGCAC
ncbi:hypothetical protein Aduo_015258 [Ancylostoma duodenale]